MSRFCSNWFEQELLKCSITKPKIDTETSRSALTSALQKPMVAIVKGWFLVLAVSATACAASDGDTLAPVRWLERSRLGGGVASLDRPPVGDAVPFRDRDHNGRYDPFVDPVGFCTPDAGCVFPERRLTIHRLRRNGMAGSSAGLMLWAQAATPGPSGTIDIPVCNGDGECSLPIKLPFAGVDHEVHAQWICTDEPERLALDSVTVAGAAISLPARPHVRLVISPGGGGRFGIHSSETIDRLLVRLVRLDGGIVKNIAWSSENQPEAIQLVGDDEAELRLPRSARDACHDCAVMIQVMRVWRDDELRDVSEAWSTVPLSMEEK